MDQMEFLEPHCEGIIYCSKPWKGTATGGHGGTEDIEASFSQERLAKLVKLAGDVPITVCFSRNCIYVNDGVETITHFDLYRALEVTEKRLKGKE